MSRPTVRSSALGRGLVGVGAGAVIVGSFLPWVASGSVERSSYELFELVSRLGFASDGGFAMALRWWPIVPLLVTVTVVMTWSDRRHGAVALGTPAVAYPLIVAAGVMSAPAAGPIRVLHGPLVTSLGAALLGAGLVLGFTVGARDRANASPHAAPPGDRS